MEEKTEKRKKAATEVFKHPTSCSIDFLLVSACEIHSQLCDTMENLFLFLSIRSTPVDSIE
jgi:hypothetical protein